MIKKLILFLFAGACIGLSGAEKIVEFINDNGFANLKVWHPTGHIKKFQGGKRRIAPNGRFGSCLELKNTKTSHCGSYSMYSATMDTRKDTAKCSIYLKGKGIVDISLLCYRKENGAFGGIYHKRIVLNSPAKWTKQSLTFTAKDFRGKKPGLMNIRFSLQYLSPGVLLADDLALVIFRK